MIMVAALVQRTNDARSVRRFEHRMNHIDGAPEIERPFLQACHELRQEREVALRHWQLGNTPGEPREQAIRELLLSNGVLRFLRLAAGSPLDIVLNSTESHAAVQDYLVYGGSKQLLEVYNQIRALPKCRARLGPPTFALIQPPGEECTPAPEDDAVPVNADAVMYLLNRSNASNSNPESDSVVVKYLPGVTIVNQSLPKAPSLQSSEAYPATNVSDIAVTLSCLPSNESLAATNVTNNTMNNRPDEYALASVCGLEKKDKITPANPSGQKAVNLATIIWSSGLLTARLLWRCFHLEPVSVAPFPDSRQHILKSRSGRFALGGALVGAAVMVGSSRVGAPQPSKLDKERRAASANGNENALPFPIWAWSMAVGAVALLGIITTLLFSWRLRRTAVLRYQKGQAARLNDLFNHECP
ncbi:Uncharacterized protein PBTT_07154 [Plasmodiophora brassicae]